MPVTIVPESSRIRFEWDKTLPGSCSSSDGSIQIRNVAGGRPPYQYRISTQPATTPTPAFGGLANGTYLLTVADSLCAYTQEVDLTVPGSLSATLTLTAVSCEVPTANLTIERISGGNGHYTTSLNGAGFSADRQFGNLKPGLYALTIQDSPLSCRTIRSVEVKEQNRADLQLVSRKDIACFGGRDGAITVKGENTTGPFRFALNAGPEQESGRFGDLAVGTYRLTARNRFGCLDSLRVSLTQPTPLSGNLTKKDNLCFGDRTGRIELSGSGATPPYRYSLEEGKDQTEGLFAGLKAGIYNARILDANHCLHIIPTELFQPSALKLTALYQDTVRCFGEVNGVVRLRAQGGTPSYRYSPDSLNYQTDSLFRNLNAGTYRFRVQDAHQCLQTATIDLSQPAKLAISLTAKADPLCAGESNGTIEVNATGGNGGYEYRLDASRTQSGGRFTGLIQGEFALRVTDRRGCTDTLSRVRLTWPQPLRSEIQTSSPRCAGGTEGTISLRVNGGLPPYTARLNEKESVSDSLFTLPGLKGGHYDLRVSDHNGCALRVPATITEADALSKINLGDSTLVCKGQAVRLDAGNPGRSVQWFYNGRELSREQVVEAVEPGNYRVEVRNATGCLETASFTLRNSPQALKSDFLMPTQAFVGDTVLALDITRPIPDRLVWTIPAEAFKVQTTASTIAFVVVEEGDYTIEMDAFLGDCHHVARHDLRIFRPENVDQTDPRLGYQDLNIIEKVEVFPNPNYGRFTVRVKLARVEKADLFLIRSKTGEVVYTVTDSGRNEYTFQVDQPLRPETYIVSIRAGKSTLINRILVTP
ncbi:SprB repeat-containing protein [Larkinella soli]|uniref:SprB repeat-containing protein n=1 Tax=Larkinella soli TaxID=1770527 RepID=UPI000FFC893D|nr:SprB repeat-containing protein [Larkinella soli]